MKLVFLCGSLEPGRDGVGDYVRRLAIELMRQGHYLGAIALNDKHILDKISTFQQGVTIDLPVLRLPSNWSAKQRFEHARKWIDDFAPDWLSLQFVPFSFHPKGISFKLANLLATLGKGRSWHIMIHELWVGMNREAPIKHKVWGCMQRFLIKSLIERLNPKAIHTHTLLYQAQLMRLGFDSVILPLFSNIPITLNTKTIVLRKPSNLLERKTITLVLFGAIYPGAPVSEFAQEVAQYAKHSMLTIRLILVGRCGNEQECWVTNWKAVGLSVEVVGEQSPEYISRILMKATLGIATTPAYLLEKSGTAAAMQEHGLPILCVASPWNPRGIHNLQAISKVNIYQKGNLEIYFKKEKALAENDKVSNVAYQFINNLISC